MVMACLGGWFGGSMEGWLGALAAAAPASVPLLPDLNAKLHPSDSTPWTILLVLTLITLLPAILMCMTPLVRLLVPMRAKAVFVGAVAWLVAPLVATLPNAQATLSFSAVIGELAVGLVYGLSLTLLSEMLIFAGQIAGLQFSFSLVNLLDPESAIQTPLLGDLFQLLGTLVLIAQARAHKLRVSPLRSQRPGTPGTDCRAEVPGYPASGDQAAAETRTADAGRLPACAT